MNRLHFAVLALAAAAPAAAQTAPRSAPLPVSSAARAAAETITSDDVRRRVGIIAHDSMGGRDTPSRGLDLTAHYVGDEFRRFGLTPGGDDGTFIQHYGITKLQLDAAASSVTMTVAGRATTVPFPHTARYLGGDVPPAGASGPVVLVGGKPDAKDFTAATVGGRVLVAALPSGTSLPRDVQVALLNAKPAAVITLSPADSATFAQRLARTRPRVATDGDAPRPLMVEVRESALAAALTEAGADLAAARAAATSVVTELRGATAQVSVKETVLERQTAPNTVGILRGSDPKLRDEYIVFSAHMDHVGVSANGRCAAMGADSICNGADDDASGTVGIVELAEAFARKGVKPKRSLIFLTVSGEEGGLRGSRYFSEKPPVPIERIVANINMDMIGRNWTDTIVAIGREHSDMGATLDRVNRAHPELRMTAIDDIWPEENFYRRSDHYNFARKGVPILFFFNGVHDDYHKPSDEPEKIDTDKESRILKLVYYLGLELANSPVKPKWNEASYRDIVAVR